MKIAIAGYGIEGQTNYAYWDQPENQLVIVDENQLAADKIPNGAALLTGEGAFSKLAGFDMVVRTAGLSPRKISTDGKIWSATNEFFAKCPAPIIGVTGTKGKGTTCSLIASILRAASKTVHLVGNIGTPALSILADIKPDDIVVYELSSFQLWDIERSPHIAVVLMIEPDHLDVHADFAEYVAAKGNITASQLTTDRVIYNAQNEWSKQIANQSVGQRLPYPSQQAVHVRGDFFFHKDTELCEIDNLQLPGIHNLENACAAIAAAWPWVQDGPVIAEGLRSFSGLPHRLALIAEIDGVKYYNDSISTTPGSAIAAIKAFDAPKIIILGGSDKGADYTDLIKLCQITQTHVIAIGQTGKLIAQICQDNQVECDYLDSLEAAVHKSHKLAQPGSIVILSPASASFDMFKNYTDRGDQFTEAVKKLRGN